MKKGFTLIELLAVIVLIAIIAVITIPIIGSAIEKAKLGALKDSAYGLIDAGVIYNAQYQNEADARFDIINGFQTTTEANKLKYKGNVENGTIVVSSTGKVLVCINSGNYKAYKEFDQNEVTVEKKSSSSDVCMITLDDENNNVLENNTGSVKNVYPVGSIYMSVDDTNPHDLFGGEWEKIATGRTLMGAGTGTDSNNVEKTFNLGDSDGEYTHTLTIAEMPSHSHGISPVSQAYIQGYAPDSGSGFRTQREGYVVTSTNLTGGNQPHNNLSPYYVVNMWKRVS